MRLKRKDVDYRTPLISRHILHLAKRTAESLLHITILNAVMVIETGIVEEQEYTLPRYKYIGLSFASIITVMVCE